MVVLIITNVNCTSSNFLFLSLAKNQNNGASLPYYTIIISASLSSSSTSSFCRVWKRDNSSSSSPAATTGATNITKMRIGRTCDDHVHVFLGAKRQITLVFSLCYVIAYTCSFLVYNFMRTYCCRKAVEGVHHHIHPVVVDLHRSHVILYGHVTCRYFWWGFR